MRAQSERIARDARSDATSPQDASKRARKRPNILFCLADDWGWPHAGALGDRVVKTPNFDRLAREGVLFSRAFVSSPSCTPCRNAILTGQQFYRLGEGANLHSTLSVKHPNFMRLLAKNGYAVGHWRKAWGPGKFQAGGYKKNPCGPRSKFDAFLEKRDPSKPFCFWFGTSDPHRGFKRHSGRKSGIELSKIRVPAFYPDHEDVRGDIADYYFEVQRWDRDVGKALALLEEKGELENTIVVMTGDHGMPFPRCKGNLYDWGARVPLAVRWGAQAAKGKRSQAFVSLTDLAPTFLEAAGIQVPEVMTGRSLIPLLQGAQQGKAKEGKQAKVSAAAGSGVTIEAGAESAESSRRSSAREADRDAARDFVVFGRERHTPAQALPSIEGYPARAIRTDRWLLIINLAPQRWPAGVPSGATHPMNVHADCDNGPTKRLLVQGREDPGLKKFYELSFAKRKGAELYDCKNDPDQVRNLINDEKHVAVSKRLIQRLERYLRDTGDPRMGIDTVKFDTYPYRARYLAKRLENWRKKQKKK